MTTDMAATSAAASKAAAAALLAPHTHDNTAPFSLEGLAGWARLVGAHDGDTATVVLEAFPGRFHRVVLRVRGVDACEMTSRDAEVRAKAVRARNRLVEHLTGLRLDEGRAYTRAQIGRLLGEEPRVVWVECAGQDKYGRTLADVYPDRGGASVAAVLLAEGLAYAYGGGTKRPEAEQLA